MSEETMLFRMFGASDDLVEASWEGPSIAGQNEYNVNPEGSPGYAGSWVLAGSGGKMRIVGFYGVKNAPCWFFAPVQVDEGVPIPDWPINVHSGAPARGYSTVLEIEVPTDTHLIQEA